MVHYMAYVRGRRREGIYFWAHESIYTSSLSFQINIDAVKKHVLITIVYNKAFKVCCSAVETTHQDKVTLLLILC